MKDLSKDAEQFLDKFNQLESYSLQEEIFKAFVEKYPNHDNYAVVSIKVKLLNLFYSTGIKAIDKVVEKIMSIKDIDLVLQKEKTYNKKLIDTIAELNLKDDKSRTNYSFATKYCALHQPQKYPIYDSIVASVFKQLVKTGNLPPYKMRCKRTDNPTETLMCLTNFEKELRNYDFFVKVYNAFMQDYGLTKFNYRDVDRYIWGSYKNGEIKTKIEEIASLSSSNFSVYSPPTIPKTITIK